MQDLPKQGGVLGHYANCLNIGYNGVEFVLDFSQFYPDEEQSQGAVRIVTSPSYAKKFSEALERAIRDYESAFGPVQTE